MKKFWVRAVPEDEGAYEVTDSPPRADSLFLVPTDEWVFCCFPSDPEREKLIPRVLLLKFEANHEDSGACEGLGLQMSHFQYQ